MLATLIVAALFITAPVAFGQEILEVQDVDREVSAGRTREFQLETRLHQASKSRCFAGGPDDPVGESHSQPDCLKYRPDPDSAVYCLLLTASFCSSVIVGGEIRT